MPGFVDPDAAMAEHDVLAMMSVWENCSYALLDAAARGHGRGRRPPSAATRRSCRRSSLVDADDATAVAATLADQGLKPEVRPGLRRWPSVADMCARIAATYADSGAAHEHEEHAVEPPGQDRSTGPTRRTARSG